MSEWTLEDAARVNESLDEALGIAMEVVTALAVKLPNATPRQMTLALLMVARMASDAPMPQVDAFANAARLVAGWLQLREQRARDAGLVP